jgi:hypothetical protein
LNLRKRPFGLLDAKRFFLDRLLLAGLGESPGTGITLFGSQKIAFSALGLWLGARRRLLGSLDLDGWSLRLDRRRRLCFRSAPRSRELARLALLDDDRFRAAMTEALAHMA